MSTKQLHFFLCGKKHRQIGRHGNHRKLKRRKCFELNIFDIGQQLSFLDIQKVFFFSISVLQK